MNEMNHARPMTAFILLARHGRVAIASGGLFSRDEFLRYVEDYDSAPLRMDARAPEELVAQLQKAHTVFASASRRARESARLLSIESEMVCDALFNEEPHHVVPKLPGRMPLLAWFASSRIGAATNSSLRREAAERGAIAARRLIVEAQRGPTALIGHGWFNRAISRSLIERGWKQSFRQGGSAPWSFSVFSQPD